MRCTSSRSTPRERNGVGGRHHRVTARVRGSAAIVLVALLAGCGAARADVAIPGAVPVETPAAPDAPGFTRGPEPIESSEPTVSAAAAETTTPMPTTVIVPTTTTTTTTTATTTMAPLTTVLEVGSDTVTVEPAATGWAAFDLGVQTIIDDGSHALSVTVLRDGEVVHRVALGTRTPGGEPTGVDDRFRIASISKVITSIVVLRLVEQGSLDLDMLVGQRLADRVGVGAPSAGVPDITLRHLLTHRSGIAQYENLMFRRQVESCEQAAATGLGQGLERAPGTTFRYSNLNFCLLGLLIEDVTGQSYENVVRAELLAPLGIDSMRLAGTFDVGDGDVEHRSDAGRNYMEVLGAAGSWIASSTDVATIIDSLDHATSGWKPLSPQTVAEMRTITVDPPLTPEQAATTSSTLVPPEPLTRGYGMGLMIFGTDSFGHTGTLESTHAMTARQSDGLTWAITVSGDHPWSTRDLAGVVDKALRAAGEV